MKIPEIRDELHAMADRIGGVEGLDLHIYAHQLHRRPPVRRVSPRRRLPRGMRAKIRTYIALWPEADYMEIATYFGVNTGRVSEALAGFRS